MTARLPLRLLLTLATLATLALPSLAFAADALAADPSKAQDAFTAALHKGPIYAALAAFVGGLGVSLTPCVYPMIAVTVSVFGARQAKHRWEGALLSSIFVFGIICMLVPLGVIAGLSGTMFGAVLQNRWVVLAMVALFAAMAASMFGAFELALPSALNNRLAQLGGIGYKGAFLLGFACGLIAAPCTGPVLLGILTFIANTRSAGLGVAAMTTFGLGLGAPFFLVGAFALQLPKSGHWMVHVKSLFGIVLLVVALYFVGTVFPTLTSIWHASTLFFVIAAIALVAGLLLGAVHRDFAEPGPGTKFSKGLGVALVTISLFGIISAAAKPASVVTWEPELALARAKARAESRPLLVDFTAAWCGACKELDKVTFSAPQVAPEMSRFVAVKVDATNNDDPRVEATLQEFKVRGLPTVVIFDSAGREAMRYNDFVAPDKFLSALKRVD